MRHGGKRDAFRSVVPKASSPQSSVCHRINFDLDICRGLHGLRDYGFASAPARSWDICERCFVRRFVLGLDEAAASFEGSTTGASAFRRAVRAKCYAIRSGQFAGSPRLGRLGCFAMMRISCLEDDLRLIKARGDRCRGASWSEQLDDKEPHGAPSSARGSERIRVFWTSSPAHPFSFIYYSMVCCKRVV